MGAEAKGDLNLWRLKMHFLTIENVNKIQGMQQIEKKCSDSQLKKNKETINIGCLARSNFN